MEEIILIFEIINLLYSPFGYLFSIIFWFTKTYLRTITVSLLIMNIGKILSLMKKKKLKWLVYIWYLGYALYDLGLFTNLAQLNNLDRAALIFSIVAPLSMLIVGKQIAYLKIKGYQIFVYLVVMFLYMLLALLWWCFYPNELIFGWVFVNWCILLGFVMVFKKFYGDD